MPNDNKYFIEYKKEFTYNDRIELIKNVLNLTLIDEYTKEEMTLENYLDSHWIWEHAFNPYKFNFEDKTKSLLDRLYTFVLLSELNNKKKNKHKDIRMPMDMAYTYKKEIPVSSCGRNIQALFYDDNTDSESKEKIHDGIEEKTIYEMSAKELDENREKRKKKTSRKSKQYKLNKLFNSKEKEVVYLDVLTNKEYYESQNLNPLDYCSEDLNDEEKEKWLDKTKQNVFKSPIIVLKKKKIKGNVGLIDRDKHYTSQWCYVDTNNEFMFDELKFKIGESVDSYIVNADNQCEQDKILVMQQDDNTYFFDMNIERIDNKLIKLV